MVHRFCLIGCFDRLNGRFAHLNTCFARIMVKWQVTYCLPLSIQDNTVIYMLILIAGVETSDNLHLAFYYRELYFTIKATYFELCPFKRCSVRQNLVAYVTFSLRRVLRFLDTRHNNPMSFQILTNVFSAGCSFERTTTLLFWSQICLSNSANTRAYPNRSSQTSSTVFATPLSHDISMFNQQK